MSDAIGNLSLCRVMFWRACFLFSSCRLSSELGVQWQQPDLCLRVLILSRSFALKHRLSLKTVCSYETIISTMEIITSSLQNYTRSASGCIGLTTNVTVTPGSGKPTKARLRLCRLHQAPSPRLASHRSTWHLKSHLFLPHLHLLCPSASWRPARTPSTGTTFPIPYHCGSTHPTPDTS